MCEAVGASTPAGAEPMSFNERNVLKAAEEGDAEQLDRMLEQDAAAVLAAKDEVRAERRRGS